MTQISSTSPLDSLPPESAIMRRLAEIARERRRLRDLLRVVHRRQEDKEQLRSAPFDAQTAPAA